MQRYATAILLGMFLLASSVWPGAATNAQPGPPEQVHDIWDEDTGSPAYPWWYRWLSDETVDRIMKGIAQRDPAKARELAELRKKDPEQFKTELGNVLKEDYDLRKRRDEILRQIRRERSDARKQILGAELQDIIARRYDLIVRRKEIAYEQLQKKLEELQRQIDESKSEIVKWQDAQLKRDNVRKRIEALTEGMNRRGFQWD